MEDHATPWHLHQACEHLQTTVTAVICDNILTESFYHQHQSKTRLHTVTFSFHLGSRRVDESYHQGQSEASDGRTPVALRILTSEMICLLSSNLKDISTKTYELDKNSKKTGLEIHPS